MRELGVAILGLGKVARDEHMPAIATTPGLTLVVAALLLGRCRIVEPWED
jgi:predicted dehydrogenase